MTLPDGSLDLLATPIAGGFVLVGPVGAARLLHALRIAAEVGRRTGARMHPDALRLQAALGVAAEAGQGFAAETAKVSHAADRAMSTLTPDSWVLLDPIGTAEAAALRQCSEQWIRACCRRGTFASARRRAGVWWMERDEVAAPAVE